MHKNNYIKPTTITATEFAKQLRTYEITNETYEKIISICNNKNLNYLLQLICKKTPKITLTPIPNCGYWRYYGYVSYHAINNFIMDILNYDLLKYEIFATDFKTAFNELKVDLSMGFTCAYSKMCTLLFHYVIAEMLAKPSGGRESNVLMQNDNLPSCKYYTVLSINKIFYNNHCYDEFFTIQNIKKYISFIITKQCKYVGHMKTFLKIVCDYMNEQTNMIFYSYMIREMKKENNIEMHHVLCDFPLYMNYTDKYFKKQKEEFIFICDKIYDNYQANVTGNRVVADEYVLKCIAKFL